MLRALIWDVDGTLAETEEQGHRSAFNQAFSEQGQPWHWDEARYGGLLAITGGKERLLHAWQQKRLDRRQKARHDRLQVLVTLDSGQPHRMLLLQIGYDYMKNQCAGMKANVQAALRPAGCAELWRLVADKNGKTVAIYQ